MKPRTQKGFTLIELLIAAAVFTYVVTSVSALFATALDLQRRASAVQKIEENAQFALESIAREVRVSTVLSGDTTCSPVDPVKTATLKIHHPVNGDVTYTYNRIAGTGMLYRSDQYGNDQPITASTVDITAFAFCVSGSGNDGQETRVTMPMKMEVVTGRSSSQVSVSLQTTVVSRDLSAELK